MFDFGPCQQRLDGGFNSTVCAIGLLYGGRGKSGGRWYGQRIRGLM